MSIPFQESIKIFLIGLAMGITPGGVGTLIKSYILKKDHKKSISSSMPVIIIEKITDLLSIIIIMTVLLIWATFYEALIILGIGYALFFFIIIMISNNKIFLIFKNFISKIKLTRKFATNLEELEAQALNEANKIARIIEKQWDITLGEPKSAMKPDIAIPSPLAEMALKASGASQIKNNNYIINRSKGRGADIEAHDMTHAQKILLIPDTLARIEARLAYMTTNYPVLFL